MSRVARRRRAAAADVAVSITWRQALAFRMERQLLDPVGTLSVPKVVRRLCGVQAQVASSAELAVRVRRQRSRPGDVERALADGRLIKTWAMRGALHLLAPEDAGAFLALFAAERVWEKPSWQRHFGLTAKHWGDLRRVVRDALDRTVLTRDELAMAISRHRGFSHLADQLRSGWGTLLKPLAWQGDLCFGPSAANRVTFTRPDSATTRWGGLPDPNQAPPAAIVAYLRASSHCIATFPTRRASSTASRSLV